MMKCLRAPRFCTRILRAASTSVDMGLSGSRGQQMTQWTLLRRVGLLLVCLAALVAVSDFASAQIWLANSRTGTAAAAALQLPAHQAAGRGTGSTPPAQLPLYAHPRRLQGGPVLPGGLPEAASVEQAVDFLKRGISYSLVPSRRCATHASTDPHTPRTPNT